MTNIRDYIKSNLLDPMKEYPTVIQSTIMEIITQRLESAYTYASDFSSIINPSVSRIDIANKIADQFLFKIREEATIEEQIEILNHILYLYRKRGSIESIENMWKYYGGDLPKEIKVSIPSYNMFRYSVSELSGEHKYPDSLTRPGVYELQLYNSNYNIDKLKEFMLEELLAAGNQITFSNNIHLEVTSDIIASEYFKYLIPYKESTIYIKMLVENLVDAIRWSDEQDSHLSGENKFSGHQNLYFEISKLLELVFSTDLTEIFKYTLLGGLGFSLALGGGDPNIYAYDILAEYIGIVLHYEPEYLSYPTTVGALGKIGRNFYNRNNEEIISRYPGFFILGESLLGKGII